MTNSIASWSSLGTGAPRLLPHNQPVSPRPGSPWAARHGVTYNGSSRRGRPTQEPNPTGPSISNRLVPCFRRPMNIAIPYSVPRQGLGQPAPWSTSGSVVETHYGVLRSMYVHSMFEPTCARFRLSCLVQRAASVVWSNHPGRDSTHHRPVRRWARFNSRSLYGACTDGQGGKAEARAPHVPSQLINSRWSQTHREAETHKGRKGQAAVSASGVCLTTRGTAVWIRHASAPNPNKKRMQLPTGGLASHVVLTLPSRPFGISPIS